MIKIVDIIIPCYNAADTLPRALASIVSQTHPEKCMVTVVDDCSTEDIKLICDNFSPYIKLQYIRNEKNMKFPGLVRQVGIDNTSCPYIMFLDADDMLTQSAVQIANNEMKKSDADVLIGAFYSEDQNGSWKLMGENDTTWLHGNIYKRSFLKEKGIKFCDKYNEDGSFNTMCYMLSDKVAFMREPMYYWRHNKKSITRNQSHFTATYCADVIDTLTFAYCTIFNNKFDKKKVFRNMGEHIAFFHKLINDIDLIDESEEFKEKKRKEFFDAIKYFSDILNLGALSAEELSYIKAGFADGYVKFPKMSFRYDAQTFFSIVVPGGKLRIEDFNISARRQLK